jgi:hypothetical protein
MGKPFGLPFFLLHGYLLTLLLDFLFGVVIALHKRVVFIFKSLA